LQSRKDIVERALGVKLPAQYAAFLEAMGDYTDFGIEVYGLTDDTIDVEKMPCVIGATKIYRRDNRLPHRLLVIHYTGIEDEFVSLDTEDEKVYAFSRFFGDRKVADSFDEWFEKDILAYVTERKRRRAQSDDDWD